MISGLVKATPTWSNLAFMASNLSNIVVFLCAKIAILVVNKKDPTHEIPNPRFLRY
jgi:hypothetical protein